MIIKEIRRRYINVEILVWIAAGITVTLMMSRLYMGRSNVPGIECAFDSLDCMSQQFAFPLIMIVTALCSQRMMKSDRDSMIILKYGSKQQLYIRQIVSTMCYSAVMTAIYITSLMLYAQNYYGIWFNWNDVDSMFRGYVNGIVKTYIAPERVVFTYFLMMMLWTAITCCIGILMNIIFSSDSIAGLVIVALAAVDMFIPVFYHRFLLFERSWYNMARCRRGIMSLTLGLAVIIIIGYLLQGKKEYYEYKGED